VSPSPRAHRAARTPRAARARRILLAATATLVSLAPLAATSVAHASRPAPASSSRTTVLADCVHHRVRPHRVFIACGDGTLFLQVRHYRTWAADEAVGRGAVWADDCDPNCADGTFHRTAARIRYFRPVSTSHGKVFSRAAVRWHHADGKHGRDVYWLPTSAKG
jgi:hypothetical protein